MDLNNGIMTKISQLPGMVIFYKRWKKYNDIQLTKNKMDLNNQKMKNHPSSHKRNECDTQRVTLGAM